MRLAIVAAPGLNREPRAPDFSPGPRIAELCAALDRAGHEVRVFVPGSGPPGTLAPDGVPVVPVPATTPAGAMQPADENADPTARDLAAGAESFGAQIPRHWDGWIPEVIHAHHWLGGLAAVTAAHHAPQPVPVALTFHEVGAYRQQCLGDRTPRMDQRIALERRLGGEVDRVITQSRAEADALVRLGVSRQRMSVVPTGVDSARFAPNGPLAPHRPPPMRVVTVGSVARREHASGVADAIQALTRVPSTHLVVVDTAAGPPPDGDARSPLRALRDLTGRLGLQDRVEFVDDVPHEHLPDWYRSADLVLCPSRYEPLGTRALEAMSCGVPVVATALGGHRDTVVDGLTGLLVPAQNPTALAVAMRTILADPVRRMAYAAAARDRTRQCHAWERVAACLDGAYRQLSPLGGGVAVTRTANA